MMSGAMDNEDATRELRSLLSAEENAQADEQTVARFLRATSGHVKQSAQRLKATIQWREVERPEQMVCTACRQNPKAHYMRLVGWDLQQRPVMYSCFEPITNRDIADNKCHMIATFEQCIRVMPKGVEQWVWVSDFQGFGLQDCSPRLGQVFLSLSSQHYPERLGMFLVVGAPRLFNSLWTVMQPLIDPKTKSKIHVLKYDKTDALRTAFLRHFDQELTDWLLREMAENRDKRLGPKKVFDAAQRLETAKADPLCHNSSNHDLAGTSRVIDLYARAPNLLMPQMDQQA